MKTIDNRADWITSITRRSTGIGSLPHHNIDTAIEYSFKFGIPFLPQIPIRNPAEFMVSQSLEGLPGLIVQNDTFLDLDLWKSQSHLLELKLVKAFDNSESTESFLDFEPSAQVSSCWKPFLWELEERNVSIAKIQIMGPLTAQWVLSVKDSQNTEPLKEKPSALTTQIFKLILARSIAMTRRMISSGIQPILYLDEPGFYLLNPKQPRHVLALQELKLVIQALQREGAKVGIHCCSNTAWESVLDLGLDILSIDTALSLKSALSCLGGNSMKTFLKKGGILSFGIIPTGHPSILSSLDCSTIAEQTLGILLEHLDSNLVRDILMASFFTPACGLGLHSTFDAELILEKLNEVYACFTT